MNDKQIDEYLQAHMMRFIFKQLSLEEKFATQQRRLYY